MKLYDLAGAQDNLRFSPNCWRIKMALEHKGLVADTVPWRFVEKDVIAFSGQKAVPVVVDGDRIVSDSWEIAKYLESAYSVRPSLFGGPAGEGLALFVKFWCEQTLNRIVIRIILPGLFACLHDKDKAYFRESREARFGTTLEQYALPAEEGVPEGFVILVRRLVDLRVANEPVAELPAVFGRLRADSENGDVVFLIPSVFVDKGRNLGPAPRSPLTAVEKDNRGRRLFQHRWKFHWIVIDIFQNRLGKFSADIQ